MTYPWTVYVRDPSLNRIGQLEDYTRLDIKQRRNDVGTWQLEIAESSAQAGNLAAEAYGIIVMRDGSTMLSGPVKNVSRQVTRNKATLTLSGVDDNHWLSKRLASPAPAESLPPYTTAEFDVRTGVCSTILRQYVNVNMGPGALSERRWPGVVLGSDPVVGSSITGRARWELLLPLLQELAIKGGDVGFQLVQVGSTLEFQTGASVDVTDVVKFSIDLGNLAEFSYERTMPDHNYVYVGGSGEGTARTIHEKEDSPSVATWGRMEGAFVDRRDTADATELEQTAQEDLVKGQAQTSLSITPVDTAHIQYGVDYGLGDLVTVSLDGPGEGTIEDVIREVHIVLTPDKQEITPAIGTPAMPTIVGLFSKFRALNQRLNLIERR